MKDFFIFWAGKIFPIAIFLLIAVPSALLLFFVFCKNEYEKEKAKKKAHAKERLRIWTEIREREKSEEPASPPKKVSPLGFKKAEQYAKAGWRKIIKPKNPETK